MSILLLNVEEKQNISNIQSSSAAY